jgi:hypothetical protein
MTPIKQRPEVIEDRVEGGNWEGDLITGTMNQSAIGMLVERSSRFTILVHFVGTHDAEQLRDSMTEIFNQLSPSVRRSLTWDQGIEMARHHEFTAATAMPVYFCEPRSPWQRGTNENTTASCVSTSPRAPTCPSTRSRTSSTSPTNSMIGPASHSGGAPRQPSSLPSSSPPCSHDHWNPPPSPRGQIKPSNSRCR